MEHQLHALYNYNFLVPDPKRKTILGFAPATHDNYKNYKLALSFVCYL